MKKTHDYSHFYRGYWSDGARCWIRICQEDGQAPMVICSQLADKDNTSVTNMAEYIAAEITEEHVLPTPLVWIEHYPEHEGEIGEYSLVKFSNWQLEEICLGGVWRYRLGSPAWSPLSAEEVGALLPRDLVPSPSLPAWSCSCRKDGWPCSDSWAWSWITSSSLEQDRRLK